MGIGCFAVPGQKTPRPKSERTARHRQQELKRSFDPFGTFAAGRWSNDRVPNLDLSETDKLIEIEADSQASMKRMSTSRGLATC